MKYCIDCGQSLDNETRRCDKCKTIQPNYNLKRRRIGAPYLVLRWALLTLLVAVMWGVLGIDPGESVLFSIFEAAFGAAIIIVMDQLLDRGL
jgi:predicted nucleic acid-binding Zn ribbon protein